jgi:putative protein-disulfide isomerase
MVKVAFHTDPACPWSWALEPVVRKLMVEFAAKLEWTFVMGGLARSLPNDPARRAGLIEEWLRVSEDTLAPLDPLLWADGPIESTYPACMAVKAAAEAADDRGYRYLRRLREGLMCERRKLDTAEALVEEGRAAGLDVERFRLALRSHAITEAFGTDLERTEALAGRAGGQVERASRGAGGAPLPTLVFSDEYGVDHDVIGHRPYADYRAAATAAGAEIAGGAPPGVMEAIAMFGRLTTNEVEVLCDLPGPRAGAELFRLAAEWQLRPVRRLTGYLWEAA